MMLNFLVHVDTFYSKFSSTKFLKKSWLKIYLGQDPDPKAHPDPVKNRPNPQHCMAKHAFEKCYTMVMWVLQTLTLFSNLSEKEYSAFLLPPFHFIFRMQLSLIRAERGGEGGGKRSRAPGI
jgi:hypothetical protein